MEVFGVKSWYDSKHGVVTVEDDVQNVVRDIKAISDRLHVFFNPQSQHFDIVETCMDGTDRLVFSVKELDKRVPLRIMAADHWHGEDVPNHVLGDDEDVIARVDAYNDRLQAAIDEEALDRVKGAGERLVWALDLAKDHHSVGGSISVPRDING